MAETAGGRLGGQDGVLGGWRQGHPESFVWDSRSCRLVSAVRAPSCSKGSSSLPVGAEGGKGEAKAGGLGSGKGEERGV